MGGCGGLVTLIAVGVLRSTSRIRGPGRSVSPARPLVRAVLLATAPDADGRPAAALPWEDTTLLGRLLEQLAGLGVGEADVLVRPGSAAQVEPLLDGCSLTVNLHVCADVVEDMRTVGAIAGAGEGSLVIANAEVLTQREALAGLIADPRIKTGILATRRRVGLFMGYGTQSRRGLIVRAASPYHRVAQVDAHFLGVLKVADAHRGDLRQVAERLAGVLDGPLPESWQRAADDKVRQWERALVRRATLAHDEPPDDEVEDEEERAPGPVELGPEAEAALDRRRAAAQEDAVALLLQGLVRASVPVGIGLLRRLFWARPLAPEDVSRAASRIGDYDEEQALLGSAVKANDGFFTTFFVSPYSKYVARWAARRGWTPNAVTTLSMAIGVLAAAGFATGERAGLVAGAVLLQLAFTFDCVDGQLARYTRTFSRFGAWLDSIFDRGKEYVAYAGLAIGAASTGDDVWLLAGAVLTLQTTRHAMDFTFNTAQDQSIGDLLAQPLMKRAAPARGRVRSLEHTPRGTWVKKVAVLPIGERFALISLTAALFDARVTFTALLVWGGFATLYTGIGRVLRSVGRRGDTSLVASAGNAPGPLGAYRDDGLLAAALGRLAGRRLSVPPVALAVAGAVPLAAAIAIEGAGASWGLVAAAVAWAVLLGGASSGRPLLDRLRWTVPPVLCVTECAAVLWIAAVAGSSSVPAAFALVCVIAFRRYDLVYRRRQQGTLPPVWISRLAGGWDGRVAVVALLAGAGLVPGGLWIAAAALGLLLAAESIASWSAFDPSQQPVRYDDDGEGDAD